MILNGKKIAREIYENLREQVAKMTKKPKLGIILVGENPASLRYVGQKKKWANFVGIDFHLEQMPESISEQQVLSKIQEFNADESMSGFMVQLPLPKHINEEKIINAISPLKDVDGFHPENLGKIMIGDNSGFVPCTPFWIMKLLEFENIALSWKNICIIGRSNIVGKPIANLMINAWATVTVCNSRTKNLEFFTKSADIIVVATGVPHLLKAKMLQEKTIIIDVGFTVVDGKIYGDADFENIKKEWHKITPVPGWVWAMTVAMLMTNVVKSSK